MASRGREKVTRRGTRVPLWVHQQSESGMARGGLEETHGLRRECDTPRLGEIESEPNRDRDGLGRVLGVREVAQARHHRPNELFRGRGGGGRGGRGVGWTHEGDHEGVGLSSVGVESLRGVVFGEDMVVDGSVVGDFALMDHLLERLPIGVRVMGRLLVRMWS